MKYTSNHNIIYSKIECVFVRPVYTHIYTYIYTYIHTHMYIYTQYKIYYISIYIPIYIYNIYVRGVPRIIFFCLSGVGCDLFTGYRGMLHRKKIMHFGVFFKINFNNLKISMYIATTKKAC